MKAHLHLNVKRGEGAGDDKKELTSLLICPDTLRRNFYVCNPGAQGQVGHQITPVASTEKFRQELRRDERKGPRVDFRCNKQHLLASPLTATRLAARLSFRAFRSALRVAGIDKRTFTVCTASLFLDGPASYRRAHTTRIHQMLHNITVNHGMR